MACEIMKLVVSGVNFMHIKGVVHRDMNPTNVFLCNRDPIQIKILDFNVSKLIDSGFSFESIMK